MANEEKRSESSSANMQLEDSTQFLSKIDKGKKTWIRLFDQNTQRFYYTNESTNETVWDLPPDAEIENVNNLQNFPKPDAKRLKESAQDDGEQEGDKKNEEIEPKENGHMQQIENFDLKHWKAAYDPETGKQYHYNTLTRQTTWSNPAEMYNTMPSAMGGDYGYQGNVNGRRRRRSMKEMQDAWDRGDRVGLWECPDCSKILTEGSKKTHPESCNARKARSVHMVQGTPSDILAGAHWRAVQDQNGQTYYYHQITKQTSWFKPHEMQNFEQYQANQAIIQNSLGTPSAGFNQWTEVTDSGGRVYYFNNITGATCWNKPADEQMVQGADMGSSMAAGGAVNSEAADVGEWIEAVDSNTGNKYYYNSVTKVTSWVNPSEKTNKSNKSKNEDKPAQTRAENLQNSVIEAIQMNSNNSVYIDQQSKVPHHDSYSDNPWREAIDQSSGRKYFYNILTNETNWELPEDIVNAHNAVHQNEHINANDKMDWPQEQEIIPNADGWIKIFDRNTSRFYYHNTQTDETTWNAPEGFVETETNVVTVDEENQTMTLSTEQLSSDDHLDDDEEGENQDYENDEDDNDDDSNGDEN